MRFTRTFMAVGLLSLSGCGIAGGLAVAETKVWLSPIQVERISQVCQGSELLVNIVQRIPQPEVKIMAEFVGAYCGQLEGGVIPSTTDSNTIYWLEGNMAQIRGFLLKD